MSKRSTSSSTGRTQPHKTRLSWVGLALIVLAGVAVVSIAVWMTQQSQARVSTAPSTATLPAAPVAAAASVTEPAAATAELPEGDGTAPEATGPRIAVEQTLYDYGDVHFNTPVETIVRVRNAGSDVLALAENPRVELVEGCWPPQAVVGSTTLQPGEETEVKVRFSMHAGMDGQHEFRVHIVSNDPVEPDKQVVILSNWVP